MNFISSYISPAESLARMCARTERDFIRSAYLTVLRREPDLGGQAHFLSRLASGISRIGVLSEMMASDEARCGSADLEWLQWEIHCRMQDERPYLGWYFRLLHGTWRRGNRETLRRIEAMVQALEVDFSACVSVNQQIEMHVTNIDQNVAECVRILRHLRDVEADVHGSGKRSNGPVQYEISARLDRIEHGFPSSLMTVEDIIEIAG
jgi:hypothetical protein